MKTFITAILLMIAGIAHAELTQIPFPQQLANVGQPASRACVGLGFNTDGSILAECRTATSVPCSGRGCQPVYYVTDYIVTWGAGAETVMACSVTRHHVPQADTVTYEPGFSAANCPALVFNTGTTVTINGSTFYYVSTDPATGNMLVNNQYGGYLDTP